MDMRVKTEFLVPGVQYTEEADLRAEVFRIACNFEKSFGTGAKQKIVDGPSCSAEPVAPTHEAA